MERTVWFVACVMRHGLPQAERACQKKLVRCLVPFVRVLLTNTTGNALIEKQVRGLVENHKNGCPWRARQCDRKFKAFQPFRSDFHPRLF
jgi:C3HC zinc finger-like